MKPLSGKPKTCKECGKKFYPKRTFEKVCSIPCSLALARKQREAKEAKEQRQKVRQWKADNKTYGELDKAAGDAVKLYVRMRDYGKPCISCNGAYKTTDSLRGHMVDGGHYRSVGSAKNMRFHLLNIHVQCVKCNRDLSSNPVEYRKALVKKYGEEKVLEIEHDNRPRKYSKDDLRRIAKIFRKRARIYKKLRGL